MYVIASKYCSCVCNSVGKRKTTVTERPFLQFKKLKKNINLNTFFKKK